MEARIARQKCAPRGRTTLAARVQHRRLRAPCVVTHRLARKRLCQVAATCEAQCLVKCRSCLVRMMWKDSAHSCDVHVAPRVQMRNSCCLCGAMMHTVYLEVVHLCTATSQNEVRCDNRLAKT